MINTITDADIGSVLVITCLTKEKTNDTYINT